MRLGRDNKGKGIIKGRGLILGGRRKGIGERKEMRLGKVGMIFAKKSNKN